MNHLKSILPIILFASLYVIVFVTIFILQGNVEFIFYVGMLLVFAGLLTYSYIKGVKYSNTTLWLLAVWGFLHLLGGVEISQNKVIYDIILFDLVGEPYNIFKYDQLIHAYGFGSATFFAYDLLKTNLANEFSKKSIIFIILFVSMGLGALNELIEFVATINIETVNVGGYVNTSLDLVFNLLGASLASIIIYKKL